MESIPEDVIMKLKTLNDSLLQFENNLDQFLEIPYAEQTQVIFLNFNKFF